jgi:8-oxo-dGTP diphosphatase
MAQKAFLRRVAILLQKAPWVVSSAMLLWRWRQARFSAGVAGVVFNTEGKVLLVEHVFHPLAPWGLPGGWVDRRESPAEAIQREMREELALEVAVGAILLCELDFDSHLDLAYLCHAKGTIGALSSELLDHGWYDCDQMPPLQKFHYRAIMRAVELLAQVGQ